MVWPTLTAWFLLLTMRAVAVAQYQGQKYCSGMCTNGTIRLVGGSTPYVGTLQVCVAGCWGTVCDNRFDAMDASVACRQLGLPAFGAIASYNGYYGYGSGPIWLYSLNCRGNESSLFDCPQYEYRGSWICDHSEDIGVICLEPISRCQDGDVHLVNGTALWNGLVEVCLDEQWTTICDSYYWTSDTSGANTVCKQLGYSPSNATAYVNFISFGSGRGSVSLYNVHCDARAKRLVDCFYNYQIGCSGYAGGVTCQVASASVCSDDAVRLVGGSFPYEGRVEVCAHGSWGTVCSNYWDSRDASVVCGQLGYQSVGAIAYSNAAFGAGTGPVWLQNLMCTGSEQQLFNCSVMATTYGYCNHYNDASVQCAVTSLQNCTDWSIRLVGGSSPLQGRVEVCYKKQWGTMCSNGWYISTFASVICRQLGYSYFNPTVYLNSYFGDGSGGIYLYTPTLLCIGNESRLQDCYHPSIGYHQCLGHSYDVGVACQAVNTTAYTSQCANGAVHLVGGSTSSEGRLEICLGGAWTTLSLQISSSDSQNAAAVLCRQLGFTSSDAELVISGIFGYGSGAALGLYPGCVGNETSIFQCPPTNNYGYLSYYPDTNNNIGLRCRQGPPVQCEDGDVRLVDATSGPNTIEGRLEACFADQWGPVHILQISTLLKEASVVCRQLQYSPVAVKAYTISTYGSAHISRNVSLSGVYCTGYESKLIYCKHIPPLYHYNYLSDYAVAVSCQVSCNECNDGAIRLVYGNTSYDGRVEVCEGGCWGPVCIGDDGWSSREAAVACRQLNFDPQGAVPRYYYSLPVPPMLAPHCTGNESSLFSCAHTVCHIENYNYAGVECSPGAEALPSAITVWSTEIIKTFSATVVTLVIAYGILLVLVVMATVMIMKKKHQFYNQADNLWKHSTTVKNRSDLIEIGEAYETVETSLENRSNVMEMTECNAYNMVSQRNSTGRLMV